MSDFKLSNGVEVVFDLTKLTHKKWGLMVSTRTSQKVTDEIASEVSGIKVSEIEEMQETEYRRFFAALVKKVLTPISDDPNG